MRPEVKTLKDLRADLAAILGDDAEEITVDTDMPEQLFPPQIIIEPSDPYIGTGGDLGSTTSTYGEAAVGYDLYLIPEQSNQADTYDALDDLIEHVLSATKSAQEWDLGEVARPYTITYGGNSYLASRVTITRPTRF